MTVDIVRFEESEPQELPSWPGFDEFEDPTTIEPVAHIWRRLESYVAYRWTVRQCVWTVQGPGNWLAHLRPVSNITVDRWDDTLKVWETAVTEQNALGFYLPRSCVYRITADVGENAGDVPPGVIAAYDRLAKYVTEAEESNVPPGASSYTDKLDALEESIDRNPAFLARALQYSGAGDLLRGYRQA